ncbi:hypothetical protein ACF0H5_013313 [Mactra antiquata]
MLFPVCRVKKISTPIFVKRERSFLGSVFGDPLQPGKFWLSRDYFGQYFEEYDSLDDLKNAAVNKTYNIAHHRYFGTQHAIYNNSIYYHYFEKQHVVRYDLDNHSVTAALQITKSHFNDSNFLYNNSKTYYDITADENGLWIVYGRWRVNGSYIHVMKADLETLDLIRVWRLPVEIGTYKNSFIACGILYLVKETGNSKIDAEVAYAYDFYHDEETKVNITLKIPFGKPSMFTFYTNTPDRKQSMLLSWDNGNIIKYHMLF